MRASATGASNTLKVYGLKLYREDPRVFMQSTRPGGWLRILADSCLLAHPCPRPLDDPGRHERAGAGMSEARIRDACPRPHGQCAFKADKGWDGWMNFSMAARGFSCDTIGRDTLKRFSEAILWPRFSRHGRDARQIKDGQRCSRATARDKVGSESGRLGSATVGKT